MKNLLFNFKWFLALLCCVSFAACNKDETNIGTSIMPNSDKMEFLCDTIVAETYIVRDTLVETQNRNISPIGVINDEMYGQTNANVAFQALLSSNNVNFRNQISDANLANVKLTLYLKYSNKYGNENSNIQLTVNRLKTDLSADSIYYENKSFAENEYETLATTQITFGSDSILSVELPNSLAQEIITESYNIIDNKKFVKFFKGLYLTTSLVNPNEDGCIYALNLNHAASKMTMAYNDTASFDFIINEYAAKVNMYKHDYSNACSEVREALANPETPSKFCFVQGLAGLKTKVKFTGLSKIADSTNIIINRAQMKVVVKEASTSNLLPAPLAMSMTRILDNGKFDFLDDYKSNAKFFGGAFSESDLSYTFNLPLHLQSLLNGTNDNGIYMVANENRIVPYRAMLYGGNHETNKMEIIVYYSKY